MNKITEAFSFLMLGCLVSGCASFGGSYSGAGATESSGSAESLLSQADRCSMGKPGERDYAKALGLYEQAAAKGSADGMVNAAVIYENGTGTAKNAAKALELYRKAAAAKSPAGMFGLGNMYFNGTGVARNRQLAGMWWRKAAAAGSAPAAFNLARLAEQDGLGFSEAMKLYAKAAYRGSAEAANVLGARYKNGNGVRQDFGNAYYWFYKAAEAGSAKAAYNLALLYIKGDGVSLDFGQAVKWLRISADHGYVPAIVDLAVMYYSGSGVITDRKKGIELFSEAAYDGNPVALFYLGLACHRGEAGACGDRKSAEKYLVKSSNLGYAPAQYVLAGIYEREGGARLPMALELYKKAAARGYSKAVNNLSLMYASGRGTARDGKQAFALMRRCAEEGSAVCQHNLAEYYLQGTGTARDAVAAYGWAALASTGRPESARLMEQAGASLNADGVRRGRILSVQLIRKYHSR